MDCIESHLPLPPGMTIPRDLAPAAPDPRDRWRLAPIALAVLTLLASGCSKSPEEERAIRVAEEARTTGRLLVQSNRAAATVVATHLAAAGEAVHPDAKGSVNKEITGVLPGRYAVVVRSEGWPQQAGTADVLVGRATEVVMNFPSGSLQLDSIPGGATVKLGATVLGQTPLLLLELPPGECQLTLEYPDWPAYTFQTPITENVESTATARLPHGKLIVETTPAGAIVQLDGKVIGPSPVTLEQVPAGPKKLRFQKEDFPTLLLPVTVEDNKDARVSLHLSVGFPWLDPNALLSGVWSPVDRDRITASFDSTGRFAPKNGIVKNLNRQKLHENWLGQRYRYAGTVKSFNPKDGEIEFEPENNELSRYRLVAKFSADALADQNLDARALKGTKLTVYGNLQAVEEPRWPSRVITLELSPAAPVLTDPPAAP